MQQMPLSIPLGRLVRVVSRLIAPRCRSDIAEIRTNADAADKRRIFKQKVARDRFANAPTSFNVGCARTANNLRVTRLTPLLNINFSTARSQTQFAHRIRFNDPSVVELKFRSLTTELRIWNNYYSKE